MAGMLLKIVGYECRMGDGGERRLGLRLIPRLYEALPQGAITVGFYWPRDGTGWKAAGELCLIGGWNTRTLFHG